jgi:hypothetical protein
MDGVITVKDPMKKSGKIDVGRLVREIARDRIGQPKTEQTVPNKRKKKLDKIREREAQEEQ